MTDEDKFEQSYAQIIYRSETWYKVEPVSEMTDILAKL